MADSMSFIYSHNAQMLFV